MSNWSETKLFLKLRGRTTPASEAIQRSLTDCLPEIETILRSGGTSPIRFTLHDSDHSFRVAQMMASLAGDEFLNACSEIEMAMLLLASYLHDIGMTPERNLAKRHWDYLTTGNKDLLNSEEQSDLQLWLDAEWQGKEAPFLDGQLTPEGIDQVEAIFAFYCRHKHNDWSGLWIRQHLTGLRTPIYTGWVQDLTALCASHHEGLSTLRSSKFDARVIGNPGKTLNLRYLAAILRVADILEFDPERTPETILRHREIPAGSRIYWYRDHDVGLRLDEAGKQLILSARTPNALVHRAVLDMVEAIDQELSLCTILEKEGAFRQGAIPEQERELYRWDWAPRLSTDITERDTSFVYIDGAFRPNSKRILQLLSGTQLYGTELAALRELLQNATDAVREQIALERLAKDTPGDPKLEAALSQIHRIQIVLDKDHDDRLWLHCLDDGVGMTREIIERHLLISGSATRPEVRALERSAKKFGFSVGRTGQFGIGVLSYFMIADRVEILTRRSTEAGDRDGSGWKFVTEGIGEFGQLERIDRSTNGTEIKLRLREDLARKVGNWETAISEYCKQTLVFSPCIVEFAGKISGQQWKVGPGWTWNPEVAADIDAALERTHSEADTPDDPYETALTKEKRRSLAQSWRNLEERAAKQLRWAGPEPVSIGRFGQGRAWVPYFEIDGDASLIYVNNEGGHIHKLPDNSDFLRYRVRARHSWKGFTTQIDDDRYGLYDVRFGLVFLETNLTEGLDPSISRESAIGMDTEELMNALDRARQQALSAFFGKFSRSRFNAINFAISRHDRNLSAMDAHWIQSHSGAESGKLLPLDAPCVDLPYWDNPQLRERACFWRDGRIRILKRLVGKSHLGQPIRACTLQDGGLALVRLDKFHVMPVWFWDGKGVVPTGHNYCERFPPTWSNLITVTIDSMVFYNRDHEWVKMVARKGELPTLRSAKAYADALESAIQSKEDAIQFLFQLVASGPSDLYTVIKENHPGDLGEVVHLAGIGDEMTLYGWNTSPGRDPGFGMKEASKLQDGLQFSDGMTFQFPDDAWWIKMVPQREAAAQS